MCLFVCIWIIDMLAGQIFPYLISNAKGGDNKRTTTSVTKPVRTY